MERGLSTPDPVHGERLLDIMNIHDRSLFFSSSRTTDCRCFIEASVAERSVNDSGSRVAIMALSDRLFTECSLQHLNNAKRWQHSRFVHDGPCIPSDHARGASFIASLSFASGQRQQQGTRFDWRSRTRRRLLILMRQDNELGAREGQGRNDAREYTDDILHQQVRIASHKHMINKKSFMLFISLAKIKE
jgi:hypothetical protein